MVVGYHLIWTAYGWWLPNDPRGSSSHEIRVERIEELGDLHFGRKRIQPSSGEIRTFYQRAKQVLAHPILTFDQHDFAILAVSFAHTIRRLGYTCYACAIMPDHIHLLIRRHRDKAEEMIAQFQQESHTDLLIAQRRPEDHPIWGGPGWKVFLNTQDDMHRTVRYIEKNPDERGLPPQRWRFVQEYDDWLPRIPR